jgi:hypothetical protein
MEALPGKKYTSPMPRQGKISRPGIEMVFGQ